VKYNYSEQTSKTYRFYYSLIPFDKRYKRVIKSVSFAVSEMKYMTL